MSGLELDGIEAARDGRVVLRDLSARFEAGRLTAVIGPNGAGKSTLLLIAAGLLAPTRGAVRLGGVPLAELGRRRLARRRAYLPQTPRVDWPISVERVVALGLTPSLGAFGAVPDALRPRLEAALAAHDLQDLRHRAADTLSGGELSRTMLARASVGDPEILVVDEPTAGLDPRHALEAARGLSRQAEAGRTVIMAVHDLDLAARFAGHILAIKAGALLAEGPASSVLTGEILTRLFDLPARVTCDTDGP